MSSPFLPNPTALDRHLSTFSQRLGPLCPLGPHRHRQGLRSLCCSGPIFALLGIAYIGGCSSGDSNRPSSAGTGGTGGSTSDGGGDAGHSARTEGGSGLPQGGTNGGVPGAGGADGGTETTVGGAATFIQGGTSNMGGTGAGGVTTGGTAGCVGFGVNGSNVSLELTGDLTPVHDPSIVGASGVFHLFSTGAGIGYRASTDLLNWVSMGQVFQSKPAWVTTTAATDPNNLWAPDISYFGERYHLYYSASSYGSNTSCIGHATSASLGGPSPWIDDGGPTLCSSSADTWNAIDPMAFVDPLSNEVWLAFGSFWSGIKLVRLTPEGKRMDNQMHSLANRRNTATEAPYLFYRDGSYFLFESVDYCCKGIDSNYNIRMGRATSVTGPYLDQNGVNLLGTSTTAAGGTLLLEGGTRWKGPGHNAVLRTSCGDYNVYHAYDANNSGIPTLRISPITWSTNGWPVSAGP